MDTSISKFIIPTGGKTREQGLIDRFEKLSKSKSKREIRKIEMALLRPWPIPIYRGKKPGLTSFKQRSIRLTFSSAEMIELMGRFIKINTYVENNSYDCSIIECMFKLLDQKKIKFSKNKKRFKIKRGERWRWI